MERADIYTRVTNQIIEALEKEPGKYRLPWHSFDAHLTMPMNAASERPYRGVNVLCLWVSAKDRGYETGLWATYNQWRSLGAQVRQGERATEVVLWKSVERRSLTGSEEEKAGSYIMARGFSVFNVAQVDGFQAKSRPELSEELRVELAETFFRSLPLIVNHGGAQAFYDFEKDVVSIPPFAKFESAAAYYSTLSHEVIHWTGSPQRLDRQLTNRFGSARYAAEEVIAELGAAFLIAAIGIPPKPRETHAAYIAAWLKLLRSDNRAIFTAASKAQQAVDWLVEQAGVKSKVA